MVSPRFPITSHPVMYPTRVYAEWVDQVRRNPKALVVETEMRASMIAIRNGMTEIVLVTGAILADILESLCKRLTKTLTKNMIALKINTATYTML